MKMTFVFSLLLSSFPSPSAPSSSGTSSSWKPAWKGPVFVVFPGFGLKRSDYDGFLPTYDVVGPELLYPPTKEEIDAILPRTDAFQQWFTETMATYDQLLDELADVPVILFGHSAGIMMAAECALKKRKNVAALVTYGGAPWSQSRVDTPCPTLVLCGKEDSIASPRFHAAAVAAKAPPSRSAKIPFPVEYRSVKGADHYAVVSEEGARRSIVLNAAIRGEDVPPDDSVGSLMRSSSEAQRHMDDIHAKIIAFMGRLSYADGYGGSVIYPLWFGTFMDMLSSCF